jgi:hypothetical protein
MAPKDECPYCHGDLGCARPLDGMPVPKAGDMSVCFYCGGFLIFTAPYVVRAMTDEEYRALTMVQRIFMDQVADKIRKYRVEQKYRTEQPQEAGR